MSPPFILGCYLTFGWNDRKTEVHGVGITSEFCSTRGPGSVVGIGTGYGLDGTGIESRWGRDFSHLSRTPLRSTQPPVQWVPGLSRGGG